MEVKAVLKIAYSNQKWLNLYIDSFNVIMKAIFLLRKLIMAILLPLRRPVNKVAKYINIKLTC
jgi:hypothetical protein